MMKRLLFLTTLLLLPMFVLAQNKPKMVAVWDTKCTDNSLKPIQKVMVRGGMETSVGNTPGYEVYDRSAFDVIMKEHGFERSGAVSDDEIKEMGKIAGVQYIIVPEAMVDDNDFYILVKMLDVERGRFGGVHQTLCTPTGTEIYKACEKLGAELFGGSPNPTKSSTSFQKSPIQTLTSPVYAQDELTKTYNQKLGVSKIVKVSGISSFDTNRIYEPSAVAKSNDPKASDTTTPSGYNRTVAQIHAAYEHLNPEWFPQPYYDYPMFYYMDDQTSEKFQWSTMGNLMNKIMQQSSDKEYRQFFYLGNYKDSNVQSGPIVPHGYPGITARFARFLAAPQSYAAVAGMMEGHFYVRDRQKGYNDGVHLPGGENDKVIYKKEGFAQELGMMPFTKGEFEKMQDEADLFCIGVLNQKVPFPIVERAFKVKLTHFEKYATNDYMKAMYCMQLEAAKEIYDGHPGNTKSGEHEALMQRYNAIMVNKGALYEAGKRAVMK